MTHHSVGGSNAITVDKALEANLAVSHVKFEVAYQTVVGTAYELSHVRHHLFVFLIGTDWSNGVHDILVFLYVNDVIDLLDLARERQSEPEQSGFLIKGEVPVILFEIGLDCVCDCFGIGFSFIFVSSLWTAD